MNGKMMTLIFFDLYMVYIKNDCFKECNQLTLKMSLPYQESH